DDHGDSIELIAALVQHLTDGQLARLVAAIQGWEMYRDGEGAERDRGCVYARGHRFRLLSALPAERLPDEVRGEIEAERAALPEDVRVARPQGTIGMHRIDSPVSHTEMASLADAGVAALFDELPDSTEDHHPRDWLVGGSVQLSREFEE